MKKRARRANPANIAVDNGREEAWMETKMTNCAQLLQQDWYRLSARSRESYIELFLLSLMLCLDSLLLEKYCCGHLKLHNITAESDSPCGLLTMAASARRSLTSVPCRYVVWGGGEPGTCVQGHRVG